MGREHICYQDLFKKKKKKQAAENIVALLCCCPRLHGYTSLAIARLYCSIFVNNLMTLLYVFLFSCQLSWGGCREMQKLPSHEG